MWCIWRITMVVIMVAHTTQAASLVCYRGSITNSKELPLDEIDNFVGTHYLPSGCELYLLIHGREDYLDVATRNLLETYIQEYGDTRCYCLLNWKSEAKTSSGLLGDLGAIVGDVVNTVTSIIKTVSDALFGALKALENSGLKIHIIAISTGADIAIHLCRQGSLDIISTTLLDPEGLEKTNNEQCATVCIYTCPTAFSYQGFCKIDFHINQGCDVQPGCSSSFARPGVCCKKRAVEFFSEAIENHNCLVGSKASSFHSWKESYGAPNADEVNYIGPKLDPSFHGSFYLCTESSPPFCKGLHGCNPENCPCL